MFLPVLAVILQQSNFADAAKIFKDHQASVFTVKSSVGQGTAFEIDKHHLFTCAHVVGSDKEVRVRTRNGSETIAKVQAKDDEYDVAIISEDLDLTAVGSQPLTLETNLSQVHPGDEIVSIGTPMGLDNTVAKGVLGGYRYAHGTNVLENLQLSIPLSPGSSGSPVFDVRGDVIGMVRQSLVDGQELNFALPAQYLYYFCRSQNLEVKIAHPFKIGG